MTIIRDFYELKEKENRSYPLFTASLNDISNYITVRFDKRYTKKCMGYTFGLLNSKNLEIPVCLRISKDELEDCKKYKVGRGYIRAHRFAPYIEENYYYTSDDFAIVYFNMDIIKWNMIGLCGVNVKINNNKVFQEYYNLPCLYYASKLPINEYDYIKLSDKLPFFSSNEYLAILYKNKPAKAISFDINYNNAKAVYYMFDGEKLEMYRDVKALLKVLNTQST